MIPLLRFCLLLLCALPLAAKDLPQVELPRSGITADELAIVINEEDAFSQQIGEYYRKQRGIPLANIIRVRFSPGAPTMDRLTFAAMYKSVVAQTAPHIQAYALTWTMPYRVDCMSMTSAFAMGFDEVYCAKGCKPTQPSGYFASPSLKPWDDHKLRPAMMLAASNYPNAQTLIDRGVRSDGRMPRGGVYLVETSDKVRSVRKALFDGTRRVVAGRLPVHVLQTDALRYHFNVMFYFTGKKHIEDIDTNQYLPGAMADHLTSAGGFLMSHSQMSALRWLEAGATGSYGTVVEPCAFLEKFPNPTVAVGYYLQGATLIEAYWKSVVQPGQGVFIGEPLASPYRGYQWQKRDGLWYLQSPVLTAGVYRVLGKDDEQAEFEEIQALAPVIPGQTELMVEAPLRQFYRIERQ